MSNGQTRFADDATLAHIAELERRAQEAERDAERLRHALSCIVERIGADEFVPAEFMEQAREAIAQSGKGEG